MSNKEQGQNKAVDRRPFIRHFKYNSSRMSDKDKQKNEDYNYRIGTLPIAYFPTACHLCGKTIVRTYVVENDPTAVAKLYVICYRCSKTLPKIIQDKLDHPPLMDRMQTFKSRG